MLSKKITKFISVFCLLLVIGSVLSFNVLATSIDLTCSAGTLNLSDNQNTGTISGTTYTATAKGSMLSKKTNTITITNNSDKTATLSFDYNVSKANSYNVNGVTNAAAGSVSKVMESGETMTISITSNSGFSNLTVTLTLSNISLTAAAEASNVTFAYDSSLGSITVDGTKVEAGTTQSIPITGAALVATANSGTTFLGWVNDETGNVISKDASYTLIAGSDMTVKAAFASATGDAWFQVGTCLFDDLNDANAYAVSNSISTIVTAANGTLPEGDYEITSGKTLLIPFNSSNTTYTTQPGSDSSFLSQGTYKTPTVYRKLTLASGANITVNGTISLPATVHAANGGGLSAGAPTGPCSFMHLNSGSTITMNSGANLYAWGFVTGQGTITAKSGSNIYECFQFEDFRGGTQTTDMDNEVFPLSQYYVQNVEVPLVVEAGANVICSTAVFMSSMNIQFSVNFIGGDSSIFSITSGSVTKKYDTERDRLVINGNGTFSCSSTTLSISGTSINSADYVLPLNGNISLNISSGSKVTISQDLAVLPGTEVVVEEGATVTLGEGISVYVYDKDQWGKFCGAGNKIVIPVTYAPGRTGSRSTALENQVDAAMLINGIVDASAGYVYTTAGGANIYSTGSGVVKTTAGTETVTYQLVQNTGYTEIPITSAKLKNENGDYVETSTNTYYYDHHNCSCDSGNALHGVWAAAEHVITSVVTEPTCTEQGYTKHTCSCGHVEVNTYVDATGHSMTKTEANTATCTTTGNNAYWYCNICEKYYSDAVGMTETTVDAQTIAVDPNAHSWGEATYTWSEDGKSCTAKRTCSKNSSHVETVTATIASEIAKAATCTDTGDTKYTASFDVDWAENQTKTVTGDIAATGHTEVIDAAVPATCTTAGKTEGKHCSVCNTVTVVQEDVAALGHTEITDDLVPPTFDATGLTAGSHCSVCGEVITAQEEIPALSGMSVNIAVNDSLDIHFYLTDDVIKDIQDYYPNVAISATITRYWLDGENKGKSEELAFTYEDGKWTDGADSDRFSYTNIAAKEMTDTMTVVILAGDKVLKTLENYSVKAYAMTVLQNTSGQSELTTALVDMLNYGAAAQRHFGYNENTPANADLTETQQGYATADVTYEDKYSSESQAAAASVSAKNNLMYTFYFDLSGYTEEQRSGATAAISYSHYTGSAVSEDVAFGSFYQFNDRLYGVDVKGMYIADGRQKLTCTLSIGGGTLTATDSIEGYIARATSGDDVYLMLMKFIDSAHAYFS